MSDHTEAGKKRLAVIHEFESHGYNIDAKPVDGDVVIKPHIETGDDGFTEFLKEHDAITPRQGAGSQFPNHIFVYDGDKVEVDE